MRILITVGTTNFDRLIEHTSSDKMLQQFKRLGYTDVQYQIGDSKFTPIASRNGVTLTYTKFFSDFGNEIQKADLVIGHAGAGTCLEVLNAHKPLIIVINEDLMDNHQAELAEQLEGDRYAYYCTVDNLSETLKRDLCGLKQYPKAECVFGGYLDKCMGFVK